MKKILAVLIGIFIVCAFTGCGSKANLNAAGSSGGSSGYKIDISADQISKIKFRDDFQSSWDNKVWYATSDPETIQKIISLLQRFNFHKCEEFIADWSSISFYDKDGNNIIYLGVYCPLMRKNGQMYIVDSSQEQDYINACSEIMMMVKYPLLC